MDFFQSAEKENVIGIVGGMGPESGIFLCNQIVSHTKVNSDQEHLPLMLMSLPKFIEDRTAFLEGRTQQNPAYEIVKVIRKLERAGANIIGIACNTAHSSEIFNVILDELNRSESRIRLVNMLIETCNELYESFPTIKRVGLMSTNGTFRSKVYESKLLELGYEVVLPNFEFQNTVIHRSVYDPSFGIKARPGICSSEVKTLLEKSIRFFEEKQAQAVILGCTEFSLMNMKSHSDMIFIDSSVSLAKALLREAKRTTYATTEAVQ
jgi:aspartate racemase